MTLNHRIWQAVKSRTAPPRGRKSGPLSRSLSSLSPHDAPRETEKPVSLSQHARAARPNPTDGWLMRLALVLGLLLPASALAHPHAWIDLRVGLVFDDAGGLVSMQQSWRIDPTYSHMLLEDLTRDLDGATGIDSALEHAAERILENLAAYAYFTELQRADEHLDVPQARDPRLTLEDRRLHLRFELPLNELDIQAGDAFSYRVFDPEYWIEILHDAADIVFVENRPGCEVVINEARPDPQLIRYAATLERQDRSPVNDLGRHFAEVATLECD